MLMRSAPRIPPAPLAQRLGAAVRSACRLDVEALKPGNVGLHGGGHGMAVEHFLSSAEAAAPALCASHQPVGARILRAVQATCAAVGCNTNLGIVLLAAPLAAAAERAAPPVRPLREALLEVLGGLDRDDARQAFAAIRLANPGGLGTSEQDDVRGEPSAGLREAMAAASLRDSIARQYVLGFADLFDIAAPLFRRLRERWSSPEWAAGGVYLDLLARWPDSHIARKYGPGLAAQISREAALVAPTLLQARDPVRLAPRLLAWDRRLKARGVNPGTTADLTVATALMVDIDDLLQEEFAAWAPGDGPARIHRGIFPATNQPKKEEQNGKDQRTDGGRIAGGRRQ